MLKTRQELTRTVTVELIAIEKLLDEAQVRQAALVGITVEGRRAAKLPLDAAEDALALVAAASSDLVAVRKSIHAAHYAFRAVREKMGLKVESFGDYGDTPRTYEPAGQGARPVLAVIDTAAA